MPIDPTWLNDDEQDISPDFEGRQPVTLTKVTAKKKESGAWFLLEWSGDAGQRASTSFNWFDKPSDGQKKANDISWHQTVKPLAKAAGLNDGDMPRKSAAGIASFLNAYEEKLRVTAMIGPDDRGYTQASKFQAA